MGPLAGGRLLLLLLLLVCKLTLRVLMWAAIDGASVRDSSRHWQHVRLFYAVGGLGRRHLRRKYSCHAMLLVRLGRLVGRVDVGV